MEAKAAEMLVAPQLDKTSSLEQPNSEGVEVTSASPSSSHTLDQLEEFNRRLKEIIRTHGTGKSVLDKQQNVIEVEMKKLEERKGDIAATVDKEISTIKQNLNKLSSEEKVENMIKKYAEMAAAHHYDEQKLSAVQQTLSALLEERQQLQAECRSSITARSQLETLCRELQAHHCVLREEALQRCREDEKKRNEITSHFQDMLTEIQDQIEQHSARNDKLCSENANLTDKLESLMSQCERREQSLEKINKHRDLQHQLTEAKLQQANALLTEAEEKHKREKEYLLREAIDKTKKCYAMKEQELTMKKKLLVQAAEWKLQAQTLREQSTVMQAQLKLYAEKFDEFQGTLAKSNEIYVRFKNEMENMSEKMKKMEKESNLWKTRFENCNKALTDMIEERAEKGQEYEIFVLKIQRLEKLCRALQDERKGLYDKIKEVCQSNANLPIKLTSLISHAEDVNEQALLGSEGLQEEDQVLTEDMTRLKEEQAKLQDFAASLMTDPENSDEREGKAEIEQEDVVTSALALFKSKPQVKHDAPENIQLEKAESELPPMVKVEENTPEVVTNLPKSEETTSAEIQLEAHPAVDVLRKVEDEQVAVKDDKKEEIQQSSSLAMKDERTTTGQEAKASSMQNDEVRGENITLPEDNIAKTQQQADSIQIPEKSQITSEDKPAAAAAPPAEAAAASEGNPPKRLKKKKKRVNKNES